MNNMTHGVIFYTGRKRIGRLSMSKLCFARMQEYGLSPELLTEVFRYGREVAPGQLAYAVEDEVIGVFYAEDSVRNGVWRGNLNDEWYTIITCWKEVNK